MDFDTEDRNLFEVQDEIVARVVGVVEPTLRDAQIKRARAKQPGTLAAYDLYLRALPHLYAFRPIDNALAVDLLEQALTLEPDFATAMAYAAWGYEQRLNNGFANAVDSQRVRAVELARAAMAAGGQDSSTSG